MKLQKSLKQKNLQRKLRLLAFNHLMKKRKKSMLKKFKLKQSKQLLCKLKLLKQIHLLTVMSKYLKMKSKETKLNMTLSSLSVISKSMLPSSKPNLRVRLFKLLLLLTKVKLLTSLVVLKILRKNWLLSKTLLVICKVLTCSESKSINVLVSKVLARTLNLRKENSNAHLTIQQPQPNRLTLLTLPPIIVKRRPLTFMTPTMEMKKATTLSLLLDLKMLRSYAPLLQWMFMVRTLKNFKTTVTSLTLIRKDLTRSKDSWTSSITSKFLMPLSYSSSSTFTVNSVNEQASI